MKSSIKLTIFLCMFLAILPGSLFAQTVTPAQTVRQLRQEIRQDMKDDKKEMGQTIKKQFGNIINATVTGVSGTSVSVSKDSKTYTVTIDSNTKFRRHYWGTSSISEISTNDKVNIWGNWTDDTHTTMAARLIRDISIMKRFGAFIGTVQSTSANGLVIATVNRGNQTVTVSQSTKYIDRKQQPITFSSISTGSRVRVMGIWDKINNTITEVTQVKDFSLPMIGVSTTPVLTH